MHGPLLQEALDQLCFLESLVLLARRNYPIKLRDGRRVLLDVLELASQRAGQDFAVKRHAHVFRLLRVIDELVLDVPHAVVLSVQVVHVGLAFVLGLQKCLLLLPFDLHDPIPVNDALTGSYHQRQLLLAIFFRFLFLFSLFDRAFPFLLGLDQFAQAVRLECEIVDLGHLATIRFKFLRLHRSQLLHVLLLHVVLEAEPLCDRLLALFLDLD